MLRLIVILRLTLSYTCEHFLCNNLARNYFEWLVDSKCSKFHSALELLFATWWNWMLSYCRVLFQLPPVVFDNTHIRTLNWPWQKLDTFSLVPLNCCEILGNQESFVASLAIEKEILFVCYFTQIDIVVLISILSFVFLIFIS